MLPRQNRLINQEDFTSVYRAGKLFSFGCIFLNIKKNNQKFSRLGFPVGLKFSSKATERNKLKRQLRNMAYKYLDELKEKVDIVVTVKKNQTDEFDKKKLEKDFKKALEKSKLIKFENNKK